MYSLVLLGTPRYSLVLLGTPWYSQVLLGTPWYSQVLLGTPWYSLVLLGTPRYSSVLLYFWPQEYVVSPLDFGRVLCGFPCYFVNEALNRFVFAFNILMPIGIIILANVTLGCRVIYHKMSRQQGVDWRRHRKMILQLWIISSLHPGIWLPLVCTMLIRMTLDPLFMTDRLEAMQFALFFVPLLFPMICLSTQAELIKELKKLVRRRPFNKITAIASNRNTGQPPTTGTGR